MNPTPEQIAEWREEGGDAWREDLEVMAKSKHENYVAGYIRAKTKPDQPEGEPVAWRRFDDTDVAWHVELTTNDDYDDWQPLYTHTAPFTPSTADKLPQRLLEQPEQILKDALVDIICQHTVLTYHCTRTWSAWGFGTMTQDDFEEVNESDTPDELADAILAKIFAPFTPITADDVPKQLVHDLWITGELASLTNGAETIATFVNAYMGSKK